MSEAKKIKTLSGDDITVQCMHGSTIDGCIWLHLINERAKVIDKDTYASESMATYLTPEQARELIAALQEALQEPVLPIIEALIEYIQYKRYDVTVLGSTLHIRKCVDDRLFGVDWMISQVDLQHASRDFLFCEADNRLTMIDRAIAERHARTEQA